jgi:hypothetical protein
MVQIMVETENVTNAAAIRSWSGPSLCLNDSTSGLDYPKFGMAGSSRNSCNSGHVEGLANQFVMMAAVRDQ